MSTTAVTTTLAESSPRCTARLAGVIYLLTFIAGISSLFLRGTPATVAGLSAGAFYIGVTLLFYFLFKPVNPTVSLIAAVISFAGIAMGPINMLHLLPFQIHSLVFFGTYCLLIGYLVYNSIFLPRFLGVLMALAGLGWLTYLIPSFAGSLVPYIYAPGVIGEGALTLWLLVFAVDEDRWKQQAALIGRSL
jgi:hypothetical protein